MCDSARHNHSDCQKRQAPWRQLALVGLFSAFWSCASSGAIIRDGAGLAQELERASGGETLRLAPGNYGKVVIRGKRYARMIVISSVDSKNPAVFERLVLSQSANITFRDLEMGGALLSTEREYSKIGEIRDSSDIAFERVHVHGSLDGTAGNDGWGFFIGNAERLQISDCQFEELNRAAVLDRGIEVTIRGNRFRHIRSDGLNFSSMVRLTVDRNNFSDFEPVGDDHPDAVQFWSVNGPPSTDVLISNNIIMEGSGVGPQGIFISDPRTGPYQRFRIVNNLLYSSGQWNGIYVNGAEDVEIRGNSTLSRTDDEKVFWIALISVDRASVTGNVTERLSLKDVKNLKSRDNVILSERRGEAKKLRSLNEGAKASVEGLTLAGKGYQPPAAETSTSSRGSSSR
jgi:hypothetical protein